MKNTAISPPKEQSHIHSVAHMVLSVICQYQGKSYRMFSEWLVEAYYLEQNSKNNSVINLRKDFLDEEDLSFLFYAADATIPPYTVT